MFPSLPPFLLHNGARGAAKDIAAEIETYFATIADFTFSRHLSLLLHVILRFYLPTLRYFRVR